MQRRLARRFVLLAAVALGAVAPLRARQSPQRPVFQSGVDLQQLDVTVLDATGHPIHGLKAEDFTVIEDGRPQVVQALSEVNLPDAVPGAARWTHEVAADVTSNDFEERRLFVIVMDDSLMVDWPNAIANSKKIARQVVERMGANDLAAVVFTRDGRSAQDFTSDHKLLNDAIDKFSVGFTYSVERSLPQAGRGQIVPVLKPPPPDEMYKRFSARTITDVTSELIAVPDKRKTIVFISMGIVYNVTAGIHLGAGGDAELDEEGNSLYNDILHAFAAARRGNVEVFTFEPFGFDGIEGYFMSGRGKNTPRVYADAHALAELHRDYLHEIASNTGGRSVVDTDNFQPGLDAMFIESGSYYLIGFRESNPKGPGHYARVEVKVNRPGAVVRSRNLLYFDKASAAQKNLPPTAMTAIANVLPDRTTPMRVSAAPFASADRRSDPVVALTLSVSEASAAAAPAREDVDLVCAMFTPDGRARGEQHQRVTVTRASRATGSTASADWAVVSQVHLKPGRYELRLGAHNTARNSLGSVFVTVDVPDFSSKRLSMSGVLLSTTPGIPTTAVEALVGLAPVVPTTTRTFHPRDRVTAFVRLYQPLKSTAVATSLVTTVTSADGRVVTTETTTIGPDAFGALRAADHSWVLPLTGLAAGDYLVSFDATAGKAHERRDVPIRIQ